MKLKALLDKTPTKQDIILEQRLKIVAVGKPDTHQIRKYEDYTVGLFSAIDGAIKVTISVVK